MIKIMIFMLLCPTVVFSMEPKMKPEFEKATNRRGSIIEIPTQCSLAQVREEKHLDLYVRIFIPDFQMSEEHLQIYLVALKKPVIYRDSKILQRPMYDMVDLTSYEGSSALKLNFSEIDELNFSGNEHLEMLEVHSKNLTRLDISGCVRFIELKLEAEDLKIIDISDCNLLSEENIRQILRKTPYLQEFLLKNNSMVGLVTLAILFYNCKHLIVLDISGCKLSKADVLGLIEAYEMSSQVTVISED